MSEEHKNQNKPQRLTFTLNETINKNTEKPNKIKENTTNNSEKKGE